MNIFHITVATLVGTMAVFGVTIATAPSRGGEAAKPAPAAAPVAAAIPAAPVAPPHQPVAAPVEPPPPPTAEARDPRLDGCFVQAIGRIPKADGLRVTKSSSRFYKSERQTEYWAVSVSVDVHGYQATYNWLCGISETYPQIILVNIR